MCRLCCRDKCQTDNLACVGHRFNVEVVRRKHATNKNVLIECSENAVNTADVDAGAVEIV